MALFPLLLRTFDQASAPAVCSAYQMSTRQPTPITGIPQPSSESRATGTIIRVTYALEADCASSEVRAECPSKSLASAWGLIAMILMAMRLAQSASVPVFCFGSPSYWTCGQIISSEVIRKRNRTAAQNCPFGERVGERDRTAGSTPRIFPRLQAVTFQSRWIFLLIRVQFFYY